MKFLNFKNKFQDFIIFSLNDIKKEDPNFYRARLNEWQNKGYIKKVIKEYYIFADVKIDEQLLFLTANKIYSPSYISFESALSYYELIPEGVFSITSAAAKHTYAFTTKISDFFYKKIKPSAFFGYKLVPYRNQNYKIAEPEKAILDYFYLHTDLKSNDDFFELRINKLEFLEIINQKKLENYLKIINNKMLTERVKKFLKFMENA